MYVMKIVQMNEHARATESGAKPKLVVYIICVRTAGVSYLERPRLQCNKARDPKKSSARLEAKSNENIGQYLKAH